MMPISRAEASSQRRVRGRRRAKRRRQTGFSLIELVIVVAIVAMLTGLAAVSLSGRSGEQRMQRDIALATAMINRARIIAVTASAPTTVVLSEDRRQLAIAESKDAPQVFDSGVTLQMVSPDGAETDRLSFYPSGSAGGGALILSGHGLRGAIPIDWLTGEANPQALKSITVGGSDAAP